MQYSIILLLLAFLGCKSYVSENLMTVGKPSETGYCPEGHSDKVIPIEYGMPSEELFEKADSGLVYLGGCQLGEDDWYCKKHDITF